MSYDGYPFVAAAHYRPGRAERPRVIVIHTVEAAQTSTTAAAVARYFASQPPNDPNPTSAHGMVDASQLIRMVRDEDTAYAAGTHGNLIGLHLEHAGRAAFTVADWATPYTDAMLRLSARQVAGWCRKWNIPAVKIGPVDLLAGRSGICGHVDITHAWPGDTTHTDPGGSWPWAKHLQYVREALAPAPTPDPVPTKETNVLDPTPDQLEQIARYVWTAAGPHAAAGTASYASAFLASVRAAVAAELAPLHAELDAIKAKVGA